MQASFQEHQADKGFAKSHAITDQRAIPVFCNLQCLMIAVFLVLGQYGIDDGLGTLPLILALFPSGKKLGQGFCINSKRVILFQMRLNNIQQFRADRVAVFPYLFIPVAKALNMRLIRAEKIQFQIFRKPRTGEIGAADNGKINRAGLFCLHQI